MIAGALAKVTGSSRLQSAESIASGDGKRQRNDAVGDMEVEDGWADGKVLYKEAEDNLADAWAENGDDVWPPQRSQHGSIQDAKGKLKTISGKGKGKIEAPGVTTIFAYGKDAPSAPASSGVWQRRRTQSGSRSKATGQAW
jgi:hypothetical protein